MLKYLKGKYQAWKLKRKITQDWQIKPEHELKYAFTCEGVEYFEFAQGFDMYYERYMAAQDRLCEIEQRVDKEYLDLFQKLLTEYLNKGDLSNAAILNQNLKDRRSYVFNVELLYNLASVWYFDKSENPYSFNYEHAEKKIASWKKNSDVLAFFLQCPIRQYLPQLNISVEDLKTYMTGLNLKELATLRHHLSQLPKNDNNKDLISMLELQIQNMEVFTLTISDATLS